MRVTLWKYAAVFRFGLRFWFFHGFVRAGLLIVCCFHLLPILWKPAAVFFPQWFYVYTIKQNFEWVWSFSCWGMWVHFNVDTVLKWTWLCGLSVAVIAAHTFYCVFKLFIIRPGQACIGTTVTLTNSKPAGRRTDTIFTHMMSWQWKIKQRNWPASQLTSIGTL